MLHFRQLRVGMTSSFMANVNPYISGNMSLLLSQVLVNRLDRQILRVLHGTEMYGAVESLWQFQGEQAVYVYLWEKIARYKSNFEEAVILRARWSPLTLPASTEEAGRITAKAAATEAVSAVFLRRVRGFAWRWPIVTNDAF